MNMYKKALINANTPFAITEAFKEIRTNMLYTVRDETCPIYAVTSPFAHAGKSVTISNISLSFADLGKRVLLIDCDMRNPVLHKIFGKDRSFGISEIAAGISDDYDRAVQKTDHATLDFVPSGHIPPNPTELLASPRFESFVRSMQKKYDAIFIDFPPVNVVVDALIPSHMITGYAIVVRSAMDERRGVYDLLSSMQGVGAKMLGFILNDVNPKNGSYYYGKGDRYKYKYKYRYRYRYRYHYGYSSRSSETKGLPVEPHADAVNLATANAEVPSAAADKTETAEPNNQ